MTKEGGGGGVAEKFVCVSVNEERGGIFVFPDRISSALLVKPCSSLNWSSSELCICFVGNSTCVC